MPDLTIRAVREEDRAAIHAINAESVPGVTLLEEGDHEELLAIARHFLVAEIDGERVAYAVVVPHDAAFDGQEFVWFRERHPRFLYVDQVAVAERARRRGVASRLYAEIERLARDDGVPIITCEVNIRPPNPESTRFHERRGYAEVGTLLVDDGRFVSLRVKALPASGR